MYYFEGDNNIKGRFHIPVKCFSLLLFAILVSGCTYLKYRTMDDSELKDLKTGESAFLKGQYIRASNVFNRILKNSIDVEKKITARYGLACIDLVTSKSADDIKRSFNNLDSLLRENPGLKLYNPSLLIVSIKNIIDIYQTEILKQLKRNKFYRDNSSKRKMRIKKLNETIRTLKYQISELQNIDQKLQEIQEKRKTN